MKSRGLEKTSTQMLTLFLSSLLRRLPPPCPPSDIQFKPPPLSSALPFFPVSPRLSPRAFSLHLLLFHPRTFPHLFTPSTPSVFLISVSSPSPSCLPLLTAGTVQISQGNCTTDRQRKKGGSVADTEGNTLRAAAAAAPVNAVRCCSTPVCKFQRACERRRGGGGGGGGAGRGGKPLGGEKRC